MYVGKLYFSEVIYLFAISGISCCGCNVKYVHSQLLREGKHMVHYNRIVEIDSILEAVIQQVLSLLDKFEVT